MPPQVSESAINYAAVLAWTAHLDRLKSSFDKVSEDANLLMERTCWAEELSIGIRVIRNYAMRTLADKYLSEDSVELPPPSTLVLLVLKDLKQQHPAVPPSVSVEKILENLDKPPKEINALAQDATVFERLYAVLKSAVSRLVDTTELTELDFDSVLSKLLAQYLSSQEANLTSANAFEGLASETTTYMKGDSPSPCEWRDVFPIFKSFLEFLVEISTAHSSSEDSNRLHVSKLRENGNNLMTNTCYPQAIQVYTDAIHMCDHTSRSHLPQLFTNRAIAFIGLNCFREAVSDLGQALQNDQTFVPAWAQMGYCQLYLGSTIIALKCYLAALRSLSGEIYPYNFPEDETLRKEYTDARALTVMPQFVQKLVSSFILALKRAEQQREPALAIHELTAKARAILARLRSHVEPEDLKFLSYSPDPDASSLQADAVRADTIRPSILTPDVAQDILSSSNVEASAVTMSNVPRARNNIPVPFIPFSGRSQSTTEAAETETPAESPILAGVPGNIRGFLNTLGNVVGDAMQTFPPPPQQPPAEQNRQDTDGQNSTENGPATTHEDRNSATNPDPGQASSHIARALSSVRHALRTAQSNTESPAGNRQNTGGGMIDALRHQQAALERVINTRGPNGRPNFPTATVVQGEGPNQGSINLPLGLSNIRVVHSSPRVPTTSVPTPPAAPTPTSQQGPQAASRRSPSVEDTEMPDAPDVD